MAVDKCSSKICESKDILELTADKKGVFPNQELVFIDWLRRIAEKFLETGGEHLVVLNSSLFLADSFEELVMRSIESIQEPTMSISLWPVHTLTDQPDEAYSDVYPATEISKLGFVLTRVICLKLSSIVKINPLITFTEIIKELEISHFSVAENATGRPHLWLDTVKCMF